MRKVVILSLAAVVVGVLAVFLYRHGDKEADVLKIIFLDVGQGDSILFMMPDGSSLLVDGGPDTRTDWLLQNYVSPYFCRVNAVLLTHPDADHSSGLVRIADHCFIDIVFQDFVKADTFVYKSWLSKSERFKSVELYAGSYFSMSNVEFYVLWPPADLYDKVTNGHSISLFVNYGDFEGLLMGDLQNNHQPEVLANLEKLSSLVDRPFELLKASHHGSPNGLDKELASWVRPKTFVVSVGAKNTYGHPSQEVLDYMEGLGSKIFRTDRDGSVEISVR